MVSMVSDTIVAWKWAKVVASKVTKQKSAINRLGNALENWTKNNVVLFTLHNTGW